MLAIPIVVVIAIVPNFSAGAGGQSAYGIKNSLGPPSGWTEPQGCSMKMAMLEGAWSFSVPKQLPDGLQ